jgi:putative oxidoreductase
MNPISHDRYARMGDIIHTAVRVVIGGLFACHGLAGLFGVLGGAPGTNGGTFVFGSWPNWWAALIELVGGVLVAVGLYTRVTAVLCSGVMAFAYFTVHLPHALLPIENGGEPAALFSWIFLLIAALGSGPIALDVLVRQRRRSSETVSYRDNDDGVVAIPASD